MKTTPIPTFPLMGKEMKRTGADGEKTSFPLRGRGRVGVLLKFSVISVFSVA